MANTSISITMDERIVSDSSRKGDKKRLRPRQRALKRPTNAASYPADAQALTRQKSSPSKLIVTVVLALGLVGWYNINGPYRPPSSSIILQLLSLSSSLSTYLLHPSALFAPDSAAVTPSGPFLDLPHAYALCTHHGDGTRIYTVDANNSVVECVGVSGERVIAAGDLGMSSSRSG